MDKVMICTSIVLCYAGMLKMGIIGHLLSEAMRSTQQKLTMKEYAIRSIIAFAFLGVMISIIERYVVAKDYFGLDIELAKVYLDIAFFVLGVTSLILLEIIVLTLSEKNVRKFIAFILKKKNIELPEGVIEEIETSRK